MTPISSPSASSREIVLSKTSLAGICLITFACGIVTTVIVDRAQSRAGDQVTAREPEPSLTRAAAEPTPIAPPPTVTAPAPTAPATAPAATPSVAAAADPLVVQMPNLAEASKTRTIHAVPVAPIRPRVVEPPVVPRKTKTLAAIAPSPVAIQAKPAVVAPVPVRAKPAVVATAAPLPTKTKTPLGQALAPARSKPATSASSASSKPKAASPKAASPKAASSKKAKPATGSGDPANGWVDPFTL